MHKHLRPRSPQSFLLSLLGDLESWRYGVALVGVPSSSFESGRITLVGRRIIIVFSRVEVEKCRSVANR